jgi:hypothetical protein
VFELPLKVSKNTVTTDPMSVDQEPSPEVRRRLEQRKTGADWLDPRGAESGAALGDPVSMRSWLPCQEIVDT